MGDMRQLIQPLKSAAVGFFRASAATLLLGGFSAALAQDQSGLEKQMDEFPTIAEQSSFGFRNGSVVVAPVPFSNPTIGSGLVLGAGYLFNIDPGSKPSMIGAAGLRSDNGSNGYGLAVNLAFDNNRWLLRSLFASADLRYDLYTPLGIIPIRQDGVLARLSLSYGVTPQLSFGANFRYLKTEVAPAAPGFPPIPPPFDRFLNVEIASYGIVSDWDRRDDTIYATRGGVLHVEAARNIVINGPVRDYNKGFANYTHYLPIGDAGVLAARASVCGASSDTPFFDQCSLGVTDGFRGFSATQFLDLRSASVQLEYRHQLSNRIGVVAFAGLGKVGPTYRELGLGGPHGAAGLGARYRVSKKFPLDFSVDYARNNLGDDLLYIYVGQRF